MTNNNFIQYIAGLLVATLLVFLFYHSRVDNIKHEKSVIEILSLLEFDSRLKHQVTALQTGYSRNYGGLVTTKNQIQLKLNRLNGLSERSNPSIMAELKPRFEKINSAFNAKLELLENLKMDNAVYRNTLHYLPVFIKSSASAIQDNKHLTHQNKSDIISILNKIETDLFRYNANISFDLDSFDASLQTNRQILTQKVPYNLLPKINQIFNHLNIFIELNESLKNKAIQLLSNNTTQLVSDLFQQYKKIIRQQEHIASRFQLWLFATSLLLLCYLAVIFFKLQRTTNELNETLSDLEFQKYAIDEHSIVSISDLSGIIIYANDLFCKISQYSRRELVGQPHSIINSGYHEPAFFQDMWQTISNGKKWHGTISNKAKDGSIYWVDSTILPRLDKEGKPYQFIGIRTDITALIKAEEEIALTARFASENPDPVMRLGGDGRVLYANNSSEKILSHWGVNVGDKVPSEWRIIAQRALFENEQEEHEIILDDSFYILRFTPLFHEHYINLYARNITDIKHAERNLNYQATHDPLTNLNNRLAFELDLDKSLENAQIKKVNSILLYIDLDQFKIVNDTCGHIAGDELLRQISTTFSDSIRDSDSLARLGGDEFGIILNNCDIAHGRSIAEKILAAINRFRFLWSDNSFEIGASIGMVPISSKSDSGVSLLSKADIACYAAKDSGRNRVQIYQFNDEIEKRQDEMMWASRIPTALAENRFILFAQLIKPIATHITHSHYEILIRLQDEEGKMVPPGAFIPAAERYGIMNSMDMWVIQTAFEMLGQHNTQNPQAPIQIAINLSGQSIGNENLLEYVPALMKQHQIDPKLITFEITETSAIANLSIAMEFIKEVKSLGCKFSLDDFGSGLSSFAYLKNMPVDFLKIDGSFVKDILEDPIDEAMVQSINQIGHVMKIQTIAEFVENTDIEKRLMEIEVDFAQGYGIEKPRPFSEVLEQAASTKHEPQKAG